MEFSTKINIGVWLTLNLLVTVFVMFSKNKTVSRKAMLVAFIWLIPYFGAIIIFLFLKKPPSTGSDHPTPSDMGSSSSGWGVDS